MSAGTISQAAYDRIGGVMTRALTGLSPEQLRTQPAGPESNLVDKHGWYGA